MEDCSTTGALVGEAGLAGAGVMDGGGGGRTEDVAGVGGGRIPGHASRATQAGSRRFSVFPSDESVGAAVGAAEQAETNKKANTITSKTSIILQGKRSSKRVQ